jgi:hypothetical protein
MTTTTTKHCGSAAPAFPTTSIVGHMPATTTTFGDHFMHASSTVSLSATRPASSARSHAVWQSVRAISRSLFGIVLAVAILLVFVARAPAQSWTPGTAYNAVTLSSNTYYTTPSYTPGGVSQFTVEAWINLPALGATDSGSGILELGSTIAAGEAMTLFTDWDDASQTHTLNFRIANGTSGTSTQASYTAATLSPGTWYHVAGSYDSSNMTVWLDGGSRTVAINPQSNPQLNFWNQNRWGSTTQSDSAGHTGARSFVLAGFAIACPPAAGCCRCKAAAVAVSTISAQATIPVDSSLGWPAGITPGQPFLLAV